MEKKEKLECECCTCCGSGCVEHPQVEGKKITCPDCFGNGTVLSVHFGRLPDSLRKPC